MGRNRKNKLFRCTSASFHIKKLKKVFKMKKIFMAIIVVVVIALVGSIAVALPAQQTNSTQISKMNTQIDIAHGSALHKGDKLQISLKDVNGKGIANQKIKSFCR